MVGFPVLHSYQNIGIKLKDGLKQGSPLSPIFFLLVIDPLLELLEKIPDIDPRCFADDLAVGFKLWSHIKPVFPVIDFFSRASGIKVNFSKTKFITTRDSNPDLSYYVPSRSLAG